MEQIVYIGLAQSFFAGIILATRKPFTLASRILAAWFFLICIEMILVLINTNLVALYSLKILPFTYGPLLYLYTRFMTRENPRFRLKYLWHFLPFIAFLALSLIFLDKPVMKGTEGFLVSDKFISLRIVYAISFFVSITAYSIATFILIRMHQQRLKTLVSYSSGKITLQWLLAVSITFYLGYVIMFIFGGIDLLMNFMPFDPYEISFIGLTIFAFLYGIFGINQPDIFTDYLPVSPEEVSKESTSNGYQRSGLRKKEALAIKERLLDFMDREKPYLDRELSIIDLSERIDVPRHFLTEVINRYLDRNFYMFINEYRVEEVKRRMEQPQFRNLTLLGLAYDSGFNSKSAFNTVFKKITGLTPSHYLDRRQKELQDKDPTPPL